MEMNVELAKLKDKAAASVGKWADSMIDRLVEKNPDLKNLSVYMRRGVKNYLAREGEKITKSIDDVSIFFCDEKGNIDVDTIFDDVMNMFSQMEEKPFGAGFIRGTAGAGTIRIELPDNPLAGILFGKHKAIKITETDLRELKDILMLEIE